MNLALIVEIALTALLAATLVYCAILERRLAALRKGQDGFKALIVELNGAIATASSSMRLLKSAAAGAAESLDERLSRARNMADELSVLATSGERIATRIEHGVGAQSERARSSATPSVLANRLDALRPHGSRSDAPRTAATGQVR